MENMRLGMRTQLPPSGCSTEERPHDVFVIAAGVVLVVYLVRSGKR